MPFAKDRKYHTPEEGGLGLLNISTLLDSIKCSWFKRINTEGINDNWRLNIMDNCYFNPICFRPEQLDQDLHPLEFNIGISFWKFLVAFWSTNHNFLQAPLLYNPCFIRGMGDNGRIDGRLVDANNVGEAAFNRDKEKWLSIRIGDFYNNDAFHSHLHVQTTTQLNFSFNVFLHFRRAVSITTAQPRQEEQKQSRFF